MRITNILHICYFASSYPGNFIASLARLTAESQKDYSVYFLFPKQAENANWLTILPVPNDHIFFCEFTPKMLLRCCRKLTVELGNHSTIAHTHFIDFLHLFAVKLCFAHNVCHYHMAAPEDNTFKRKIRKLLCNIIYFNSIIIGVSEPVSHCLRTYFKFAKCECITNAIDFEKLDTYTADSKSFVRHSPNNYRILIHGSHFLRKGVDLAIQAVEQINHRSDIKCHLLITAHPPHIAEEFANYYAHDKHTYEVIDVVQEIKDLYDNVDVFISPSRSEAFAYAVAESSYCNCQVIASDVPGQNTMKDIPGIIWVEPNSVQSIENAILIAMDRKNTSDFNTLKAQQRKYVLEHYGIDTWVEKNISLYKKYF